jgi:hypothetical protein
MAQAAQLQQERVPQQVPHQHPLRSAHSHPDQWQPLSPAQLLVQERGLASGSAQQQAQAQVQAREWAQDWAQA